MPPGPWSVRGPSMSTPATGSGEVCRATCCWLSRWMVNDGPMAEDGELIPPRDSPTLRNALFHSRPDAQSCHIIKLEIV